MIVVECCHQVVHTLLGPFIRFGQAFQARMDYDRTFVGAVFLHREQAALTKIAHDPQRQNAPDEDFFNRHRRHGRRTAAGIDGLDEFQPGSVRGGQFVGTHVQRG